MILQEIMYTDPTTNNTNSYSGYEVLNVGQNSPISSAQFSITQYASAVTISGLEMIQNSGKEAIIDLLDGRMEVAEAQLANRISGDLYGDGTGNAGKNLTGLAAAVPDDPTTVPTAASTAPCGRSGRARSSRLPLMAVVRALSPARPFRATWTRLLCSSFVAPTSLT